MMIPFCTLAHHAIAEGPLNYIECIFQCVTALVKVIVLKEIAKLEAAPYLLLRFSDVY